MKFEPRIIVDDLANWLSDGLAWVFVGTRVQFTYARKIQPTSIAN